MNSSRCEQLCWAVRKTFRLFALLLFLGAAIVLLGYVYLRQSLPRLEGEIGGNNLDDNGNGLVDERGLSFVLEGGRLTVRVTVEKKERDGSVRKETSTSQLRIDD